MNQKSAASAHCELVERLKQAGHQELVDLLISMAEYRYKEIRRSATMSGLTAALIVSATIMTILLGSSSPYLMFTIIVGAICALIIGGISLSGFLLARKQKKLLKI